MPSLPPDDAIYRCAGMLKAKGRRCRRVLEWRGGKISPGIDEEGGGRSQIEREIGDGDRMKKSSVGARVRAPATAVSLVCLVCCDVAWPLWCGVRWHLEDKAGVSASPWIPKHGAAPTVSGVVAFFDSRNFMRCLC